MLFKARLRLKWLTRCEVFRPDTQIAVTSADKVADISMLLSSVLPASSGLCINEESQTAGRTFCVKSSLLPCLVHCQTKLRCCAALVQPKHFAFTLFSDRGAASPSPGVTLQCVKRKG